MFIEAAIAAREDKKMPKPAPEKDAPENQLSPRSQAVDDLARKAEKAISTLQFIMSEVSSDTPSKAKASFAFDTGVLWVQQLLNEARSIAAHRDAQAENI